MSGTGPPAQPPGDFAGLFGAERARLSDLLGGLEPGDWQRPSPGPVKAVTIAISGPVTRTWQLVATAAGWEYHDEPGTRAVAFLVRR